jgi:hypothetical protein
MTKILMVGEFTGAAFIIVVLFHDACGAHVAATHEMMSAGQS